jgi:hypothetical protein
MIHTLTEKKKKKKKKTGKLSKNREQEMAVNRMWKVRTKIVPVISGALGTCSCSQVTCHPQSYRRSC